jgi:hypothetical protein
MSNALATILQSLPTTIDGGLDEDTLAVAGNAMNGNKRISIKGRVFRKYVGGKEQSVNTDNFMNVIFVKLAHDASRTFYSSGYKEGAKIAPVCWSSDSKTPNAEVKTPGGVSCSECPNSVKGSGQNGMGTACKLSWRTAVVLENDPGGDVYQLVLPATSSFGKEENGRWPFRPYVQMLANNNVSAGRVSTRMEFDINSPVPRVLFSPAKAVPAETVDVIKAQGKSVAAENAIKLTVFKVDNGDEEGDSPQPVRREAPTRAPAVPTGEVSDVIKKWAKK